MLKAIANVLAAKRPVRQGVSPEEVRLYAARAAQRARVGGGQFGQVYEAAPGAVVKEIDIGRKQQLLSEINTQAKAAELGIAPSVKEVYLGPIEGFGKTFPIEPGVNPEIRGEITMQDLRKNYVPLSLANDLSGVKNPALTQQQYDRANLITEQQLAQLALNKISLGDRHGQNVFVNTLTGRPVQIDFGSAQTISNVRQQAAKIANSVSSGLNYANLPEEASIFKGLFNELIQTDPMAALDIAKQGLSRLQKIKAPIDRSQYKYATVTSAEDFIPTY
jgi:hypothetical protein